MAEILEDDKMFVQGVSTKTTKDCLKFYMERISDLDVKDVTYGQQTGESVDAIVTFTSTIDFDKIQEGFEKRSTLEGKDLSIKGVPLCKTILVKNLPVSATEDSVMNKFENKRAGGGEVENVDLDLEKKIATIEFKDPKVIDNVLSMEQTLDKTILSVERCYPILNSLPDVTKEETSDPPPRKAPIPKPRKSKPTANFTAKIDRDLYNYLKDNHPAELSLALKDPQPNIEIKEESVNFTFTSQDGKEHFLTNLQNYKSEIVPINLVLVNHGLPEQIQGIISIFNSTSSVSFIECYNEGFIKLVGRAVQTFDRAMEEVKKCIDDIEEKSNQSDDVIEILPIHLKLLQRSTDFQRLVNAFKKDGCEIQLDDTTGRIMVKGSLAQIQKLKATTLDIVGRFVERSLNQSKFSFLGKPKGLSQVMALFPSDEKGVEILVNDQENVVLHGLDKVKVQQAYDTIDNAIDELKLPSSLHTKSSQDAFLNELGTSIPLTLQTDGGQPRIVCFKNQSRILRDKLDDFLERKKTVEVRVSLDEVTLRFVSLHGGSLLDGLRLSSPGLNIDQGSDGFVLSGERLLVSNCYTSIKQFTTGLKFESMNYGTPEIAASIKGRATMAIIQNIENKHRCAIVVTTKKDIDTRSSFRVTTTSPIHNVHNLNEKRERTMQCRYIYPSGKIIEIHQGDILSHGVDYLVNSANDELKHAGGLARAIVDKGGQEIQEESWRALRDEKRDKLLPGEVVTTGGGSLMCKVLHVVVPKYSSIHHEDEEGRVRMYLKHCCTNVLKKATDGQTIAIPALGTGIYNVPYDISAKSLIEGATEFFQEHPNHALKQVHFVDNEPRAITALMKEMMGRFKHDSNFKINDLVRDRWTPYLGAASVSSPTKPVAPSGDMAFKTTEGMEIRLTIGNIAKSTTDVIVNTVASDLNLTKNPCSKAILSEAGDKIKPWCEKWIKDNGQVKDGDFAMTDGANLKCKNVLHVSCPPWTADQGEKKLRQLVQRLLDKVQSLSLTSISIPAIGTGSLKFPEDLVAKVLFEEAMKFSSKHSASLKIKQYNVVVYKDNTKAVDIFKQQFQVFSNKKIVNEPNVPKTKRRKPQKPHVFGSSSGKDKGESSGDKTNGVEVEIIQGNIVEESTDAVGFLVSEDIEQGGQIGQALARRAGDSLRQEYSTLTKIEAGTVVLTGAGNLKTRCLLHMVIKNAFLKTDKSMIHDAVKGCLNYANDLGLTSLSLPAVGTGHLKKDAKQCAEILYSCIKEYRKRSEKTLKLIRIVILQENVFADFKKAFGKKDPTTGVHRTRQQITLTIAAENENDIAKIKEELRQVEAEQSHSEVIEARQKLDERQLNEISEIQDVHDVRIECEPEIGFIRISGLAKNVLVAMGAIHEKIHAWEQEKHHMDVTVREVQWFCYQDNDGAVIPDQYSDSVSAKIERAYKNDPSGTVEVIVEEMKCKIDFKSMTDTCLDTKETMKVFRRPCEAFPLPSDWEFQPIDCSTGIERKVHCFNIDKNTTEYNQIHDMFIASLSITTPNAEVIKIERIQNPRLYQIYEGQKKKMIDGGNEMKLYHGTARSAVENINNTGFNRAYCGKNAVRFGKGVYFANQAWYSARRNYAVPDENGLQYIYIARVLVGKFTKGKEGLLVPPPLDNNNETVAYDSVVDDEKKPTMFVIFYDYQSYPEYLVTFKAT